MSWPTWSRKLATIALVVLGFAGAFSAYHYFSPTRFLSEARLGTLANGRTVLVAHEVAGSSMRNGQWLRFDVLDTSNGERLHRTLVPIGVDAENLDYIGGDTLQWWGKDDEFLVFDVESGEVIGDEGDVIDRNPALRGELHGDRYRFVVDERGPLYVSGGDGRSYSVDPRTLVATLFVEGRKAAPRATSEGALPRVVSESEDFASLRAQNEPNGEAGDLERVCRTVTEGPCTLRLRRGEVTRWQLGDDELDGKSVLAIEARDARLAYVYVAADDLFHMFFGGVWIYAVELATGDVAWRAKL